MRRIGDVGALEPCILSDEDLGNLELLKVMPDTWNNVPWTVTNSVDVLKNCCLSQRRLLEQVKSYSIQTVLKIMRSTYDFIQENESDH